MELEPEVAQLMELPAGTKAIYLYRKRFADDEPIVRVETYLPYEACSFILGHDFNRESLYQVLSSGTTPGSPTSPVSARPGPPTRRTPRFWA